MQDAYAAAFFLPGGMEASVHRHGNFWLAVQILLLPSPFVQLPSSFVQLSPPSVRLSSLVEVLARAIGTFFPGVGKFLPACLEVLSRAFPLAFPHVCGEIVR